MMRSRIPPASTLVACLALLAGCPRQQAPVYDGKEAVAGETAGAPVGADRAKTAAGGPPSPTVQGGADESGTPGGAADVGAPAGASSRGGPSDAGGVAETTPPSRGGRAPAPRRSTGAAKGARDSEKPSAAPSPPASSNPAPASAEPPPTDPALGRTIWKKKCKTCHGMDGRAETTMGRKHEIPDVTDPAWKRKFPVAKIVQVVRDGVPGTKMRAFGKKLSDAEIEAVARFMRSL